MFRLIQERSFQ